MGACMFSRWVHLDAIHAVGDLAVVAPPGRLLALVEWAVVGGHHLQHLASQSASDALLVLSTADGRAHHVLGSNLHRSDLKRGPFEYIFYIVPKGKINMLLMLPTSQSLL